MKEFNLLEIMASLVIIFTLIFSCEDNKKIEVNTNIQKPFIIETGNKDLLELRVKRSNIYVDSFNMVNENHIIIYNNNTKSDIYADEINIHSNIKK